jgi:hypothetical protein
MMGRQTVDQSQLFYLFNLEGCIPERHLLRWINPIVMQILAELRTNRRRSNRLRLSDRSMGLRPAGNVRCGGFAHRPLGARRFLRDQNPGGVMTYGTSLTEMYRQVATMPQTVTRSDRDDTIANLQWLNELASDGLALKFVPPPCDIYHLHD